jgi:hypothetical protein
MLIKKVTLSMGQFANALDVSHEEAMKLLSLMGVDVIDKEEAKAFLDDALSHGYRINQKQVVGCLRSLNR